MRARGRSWLVSASSLLLGCSTCGPGGSAVPFKRGEATSAVAPSKDAGAAAASGQQAPTPGIAYPALTASVQLEGAALKVADRTIRAALPYPGDDGKAALLVTQDPAGALALESSELRNAAWTAPKRVTALGAVGPAGMSCAMKTVRMHALGARYALVDADLTCEPATNPPAPSDSEVAGVAAAAGEPAARHLWIATLEPTPRVLQHIEADAAHRADAARIEPTLTSHDLDGDGRLDLLLTLSVAIGAQPATRIELKLFDRAGGLAPSNDEPEKTLLALADQAKNERKRNANHAFELAQQALALHAALCRESATSRVRIGGRGLDCGPSLGAGRAASVLVATLATQGKVLAALALYQTLEGRAYQLTDNDRERARVALSARVDNHSLTFRQGPQVEPASSLRARRSAIAFLDEGHLLLRGTPARSYDLATGTLEAIGIPAAAPITSPDGRFAINAVVRSCDGYHLSVVRAAQAVAGVVTGPSVSEPLIAAADPPPGAACPDLSAEQRRDDGGLRVLDWTTQGVLLARAQTLLLLALDAAALAQQPARALAGSDAVPVRPHSDQLTADGRYLALLTPMGVAIYDRAHDSTRLLAVPEGAEPISDVALSPSGSRLAFVRGRAVYIGQARQPADSP